MQARKRSRWNVYRRYWPLLLMMLPGVAYIFINNYLPMFGIIIAFKDVNYALGILNSPWVGLSNFTYLFKTQDAWVITRNTLLYNAAFIVLGTSMAVLVAILISDISSHWISKAAQTILIMPALVSMVIVSCLGYGFLATSNGFLNRLIVALGGEQIKWYATPEVWPWVLVAVYLWKNVGFNCVIYIASIAGINPEYYEAARIDGVGKWKQIWYITLPLIRPTIVMMTILAIGRIFYSDFGLFYQVPMNSGAVFSTTNTIDTYVYRGLMTLGDIGMSSAAGLYQSAVGFILVVASNLIVRKFSPDNALL